MNYCCMYKLQSLFSHSAYTKGVTLIVFCFTLLVSVRWLTCKLDARAHLTVLLVTGVIAWGCPHAGEDSYHIISSIITRSFSRFFILYQESGCSWRTEL